MNQYLMFHKLLFVDDVTRRSKKIKLLPLLRLCCLLKERGHGWNNAQGWSLSSNDGYVVKTVEPTNKRDLVRCGGAVRRLILVLQTGFNTLFNMKYISACMTVSASAQLDICMSVYICYGSFFNMFSCVCTYVLNSKHSHALHVLQTKQFRIGRFPMVPN